MAQVSQYQKGKTNLDLLEQETVSGSGVSWAICKSAPHQRHRGHCGGKTGANWKMKVIICPDSMQRFLTIGKGKSSEQQVCLDSATKLPLKQCSTTLYVITYQSVLQSNQFN